MTNVMSKTSKNIRSIQYTHLRSFNSFEMTKREKSKIKVWTHWITPLQSPPQSVFTVLVLLTLKYLCLFSQASPDCLEFHFWRSKAILILQRALPLENLTVYGKLLKGHQGQDQGQHRPWPLWRTCTSRPAVQTATFALHVMRTFQHNSTCRAFTFLPWGSWFKGKVYLWFLK